MNKYSYVRLVIRLKIFAFLIIKSFKDHIQKDLITKRATHESVAEIVHVKNNVKVHRALSTLYINKLALCVVFNTV